MMKLSVNVNYLKKLFISFFDAIDNAVGKMSEKEITGLKNYISYFFKNHDKGISPNVSSDKIKAFLLLLSQLSDANDANRILTYLESIEFGWHGDKYHLNNHCLRHFLYNSEGHCKEATPISDTVLATEMGLIKESCKCFLSRNKDILISQPNRATLRSDPTQVVR